MPCRQTLETFGSGSQGLSGLFAAAAFIFGLKRMSSPTTALSGIVIAGIGMVIAVAAGFLAVFDLSDEARSQLTTNLTLVVIALLAGGGWAWWRGRKVAITAMPQMVALYNGMGGGAAAAIAAVELCGGQDQGSSVSTITAL